MQLVAAQQVGVGVGDVAADLIAVARKALQPLDRDGVVGPDLEHRLSPVFVAGCGHCVWARGSFCSCSTLPCVRGEVGRYGGVAGREVRPAAHLLFFVSPKKGRQKKGDPTGRVPALRCGQPAMLGPGAALRNSLRAPKGAPLGQPQRVRARSMGLLRSPCPPHALRFSARPEGIGENTGHRCARPQGSHTGCSARTGAPRRPRSRPSQRPPWPGLYRPLAVSPLAQQRGEGASAAQGGVPISTSRAAT